jgi:hypothetical protein
MICPDLIKLYREAEIKQPPPAGVPPQGRRGHAATAFYREFRPFWPRGAAANAIFF